MRADLESPVLTAIVAPFARLGELPTWAKIWTLIVAAVQAVAGDMFLGLFLLLLCSSCADWVIGKRAARERGEYKPELAHLGLHSKAAGLVLVLFVYGLTVWARRHLNLEYEQFLSVGPVALGFAFVLQDLESIDEHRQRMGARPVPLLSALLRALRAFPDRVFKSAGVPPEDGR